MNNNDWRKAVDELAADLMDIEKRAESISSDFAGLYRAMNLLKVDVLKHELELQRRDLARMRGFTALKQDRKKLGISLGAAFAGIILGGALSKDKYYALNIGVNTLDASLQEFGSSRWAVSLDRQMLVIPVDQIYSGRLWVTWESLNEALEELKQKPLTGEQLGEIEAIVSYLMQDNAKLKYLTISGKEHPSDKV